MKEKITKRIGSWKELRALIKEDLSVNDRSWRRPGFRAMAVYRFGAWASGIESRLWRRILRRIHRSCHVFVRNVYGIEIHVDAKIGRRLRVAHQSGITVHPAAVIGDDCLIRQGVSIGRGPNHGGGRNNAAPVLGDRVEVGANAIIVGGITVGDNVVIGPGAVVMRDVPADSIVASPVCKVLPRPSSSQDEVKPAASQATGNNPLPDN